METDASNTPTTIAEARSWGVAVQTWVANHPELTTAERDARIDLHAAQCGVAIIQIA